MNFKKRIIFPILFIIFATVSGFGQSVKITSKTVIYNRPKPKAFFKDTFTIRYPIISGKSPSLNKKISESISYAKVLNFSIEDEMGEFQWLEEADFTVNFNKKGVLSIYLSMTGITAHQTYFGKNVTVDLKTGKQVNATDVFRNFDGLIAKIKEIQTEEIEDFKNEIKKSNEFNLSDFGNLFEFVNFQKSNLEDFSISDEGVTFQYSYGFPYIIHHIEPSGNYFLNWTNLKPFIKRSGLLGKFIR